LNSCVDQKNKPVITHDRAREQTQPNQPFQKTPIIGRNPHLTHAVCDPSHSYCVPAPVHHKLAELLAPKHAGDRDAAKVALEHWYPTVFAKLPDKFVMGDAFRFWQSRFDAEFANQDAPKRQKMGEDLDSMVEGVRANLKAQGVIK
jgi:hypothetical protein